MIGAGCVPTSLPIHHYSAFISICAGNMLAALSFKGEKSPISDTEELNFGSGRCSSAQMECTLGIKRNHIVSYENKYLDLTIKELKLIREKWDEKGI